MALSQFAKFIVQITRRDSDVQLIIVIFSYLSGNRWTILWRDDDRFLSLSLPFVYTQNYMIPLEFFLIVEFNSTILFRTISFLPLYVYVHRSNLLLLGSEIGIN